MTLNHSRRSQSHSFIQPRACVCGLCRVCVPCDRFHVERAVAQLVGRFQSFSGFGALMEAMVSDAQFSFEMEEMQKSAAKDKVSAAPAAHACRAQRTGRATHATHAPVVDSSLTVASGGEGAARCDRARRAGRW